MVKDTIIHIQEAQKTLSKTYSKKSTLRYITVKLLKTKDKEKILKAKEKQLLMHKGSIIRLTADFPRNHGDQKTVDDIVGNPE